MKLPKWLKPNRKPITYKWGSIQINFWIDRISFKMINKCILSYFWPHHHQKKQNVNKKTWNKTDVIIKTILTFLEKLKEKLKKKLKAKGTAQQWWKGVIKNNTVHTSVIYLQIFTLFESCFKTKLHYFHYFPKQKKLWPSAIMGRVALKIY